MKNTHYCFNEAFTGDTENPKCEISISTDNKKLYDSMIDHFFYKKREIEREEKQNG